MKQQPFEHLYEPVWRRFDELTEKLGNATPEQTYALPGLYRRICNHYALARARYYSPHLVSALQRRVHRGHRLLYRRKSSWLWRSLAFLWIEFPAQVRRNHKYFWLACVLFYIPAVAMAVGTALNHELIYSVMPDQAVAQAEYSYDPTTRRVGRNAERQSDTDFMMFGYYIYNNISIGFRCFALGMLAGIGTVAVLLYNGIMIGGLAGHMTRMGFSETFWPFVSGHSALELTAIVICGAAGLRLARPIISPGRHTRLDALKIAGSESIQLVTGAAAMLALAAFIEAFWSSSSWVPVPLKLVMGAIVWALVIAFLLNAGKLHADRAA